MKKRTIIILSCFMALALALLGFLIWIARRQAANEVVEEAGQTISREEQQNELIFHGQSFPLKDRIDTFLLIGTDSSLEDNSEADKDLFYNHIQADTIVLFVLDNAAKKVTAIQINRDTMMDVPWLDVVGNIGGTSFEQIALSYNSGSGLLDSAQNTKRAVSKLLFDAPIDYCLAFNMTGIGMLNDLVGGVTVKIVDDMTAVDETLIKGSKVTLRGKQAEHFLRARMVLKDDTNTARMRRHRDYFDSFMVSARNAYSADSMFVMRAIKNLNPYMTTDMSADIMNELVTKIYTYENASILYADGELKKNEYYEFYPDENSLWDITKTAFCQTD